MTLPWEWMADAYAELDEAGRSGDESRLREAAEQVGLARDACGHLGGLLIVLALERGGLEVQRKLSGVFGAMARGAWRKAQKAEERSGWAAEMIDVLLQRVRELERQIGDLTPGVGDPRLRAA